MAPGHGIEAPGGAHGAAERVPVHRGAPGIASSLQPGVVSGATFEVAIHPPHRVPRTAPGTARITEAPGDPPTLTHESLVDELWAEILGYLGLGALHRLDLVSREMRRRSRALVPERRFGLEIRRIRTPAHLGFILGGDVPYAFLRLGAPARRRLERDAVRAAMALGSQHRGTALPDTLQVLSQGPGGASEQDRILHAAQLVRKASDVSLLIGPDNVRVMMFDEQGLRQLFTVLVGRAAVIGTRSGGALMARLEALHRALSERLGAPLPDLQDLVQARPANGLLPLESVSVLREFSVRTNQQRTWPSAQDLLARDRLYGDTPNAVHFAYWLACGRTEQLADVLGMDEQQRLPVLRDYHVDRGPEAALPEEMEALLQRVVVGTRPLATATQVREVLAQAEGSTARWPTWIDDRRQLLEVLGGHVRVMSGGEHALAMEVLREANDALPAPRRIDLAAYDR